MKKRNLSVSVAALSLCAATLIPSSTHAGLIAYEGFDYAAGTSLVGQSGGIGFSNAWSTSTGVSSMQAPGWGYSDLQTTGNKLLLQGDSTGNATPYRNPTLGQGADGTTVWISLIGQSTGALASTNGPGGGPSQIRPVNMSLYDGTSERLAIGEGTRNTAKSRPDTDVWGLVERGGVDNAGTRWTTAPMNQQSFVVVRIDYGLGNLDTAYMWVNPALDVEPLIANAMATTSYTNMGFTRIRPFAGNPTAATGNVAAEGYFDEIRIGTLFRDVAPIPEPAAVTVGLLGAGLLCLRRRSSGRR